MLTYKEIEQKLNSINRPDIVMSSAIEHTDFLLTFVNDLKPNGIIEIGTYNGISTAVFASITNHVYTYDIAYRGAEFILNLFGVREKVSLCVAPQEQIDFELNVLQTCWGGYWKDKLAFDLAFIDGNHTYESVKHDFELVKFTKRVLFHDVNYEPIKKFVVDELNVKILSFEGNFGYWEAE